MVIAYGGKHQPRGFVLLGANISPSNRQGHVRALSVYAAAENKNPGTEAGAFRLAADHIPTRASLSSVDARSPARVAAACLRPQARPRRPVVRRVQI